LALYEGLPHQTWEKELLAKESKEKKTIKRHGFSFYDTAITPKKQDKKDLWAICCTRESFRCYGGMKWCGGFHPDWCLEWKDGDKVYRVLICFGCHEARLYGPKNEVLTDLDKPTIDVLKRILAPYRKNRPLPKAKQPPKQQATPDKP
jgi:hypothetical protein